MREWMITFFTDHTTIIVFLHIISAVIWVGGMIAIRIAVHPSLQSIDEPKIKLGKTLQIVGRLFHLVIPFITLLILTAILMAVGLGFKHSPLYPIVHVKEGIWTVMTLNFIYMYIKRHRAQKLFNQGELAQAKAQVSKLPNLLLLINIVLGVVAIYLGVVLRGM